MRFFLLAFLALGACAGQQVTAASGVKETRLERYVGYPDRKSVAWLDNNRVVFIGAKPGVHIALPDGRRPPQLFLLRWNIDSGMVETVAELGESATLCLDRGYVHYTTRIEEKFVHREGVLGRESESATARGQKGIELNELNCHSYDRDRFKAINGNTSEPLRNEHEFWMFRRDAQLRSYVAFVSMVGGERREVATPISGPFFRPIWSEYANAYVFSRPQYVLDRKNPVPNKAWVLRSAGEVTEINVPPGPWLDASHGVHVVQGSYFLWSHNTTSQAGGGYVFNGEKIERIISGYVHDLAVSPDGCKVAMSISGFTIERFSKPDMTVLDVCSRR